MYLEGHPQTSGKPPEAVHPPPLSQPAKTVPIPHRALFWRAEFERVNSAAMHTRGRETAEGCRLAG